MCECKICSSQFDSFNKLSKHLTYSHQIKAREYYNKYVKSDSEGLCQHCGKITRYININSGYKKHCASCKSATAREFRARLKQDTKKFKIFTEKVSANQSKIWGFRKESGEDIGIRNKIGNTLSKNNLHLTAEQRKEKYGWLNKLSKEEKRKWINDTMLLTGSHRWWKEATVEQKQLVRDKRISSMTQTIIELVNISREDTDSYIAYSSAVDYITSLNYGRFINLIDPERKRGKEWHLDHKFSRKAGFLNNVDPRIVGNICNLRLISSTENLIKCMKCSITLEDLLEDIENSYGLEKLLIEQKSA